LNNLSIFDQSSIFDKNFTKNSCLSFSEYERRFVLRIHVPFELKTILQDDREFILRQRKVIPLPAPVSVNSIFETFLESENLPPSVIDGMENYFNAIDAVFLDGHIFCAG